MNRHFNFLKQSYSKMVLYFLSLTLFISFTRCNTDTNEEKQMSELKNQNCCIKKDTLLRSEITCPKCGHKKTETMPTDICLIKYTCENCKTDLLAKEGDCCVFCSYGSARCPSKQLENPLQEKTDKQ